MSRYEDEDYAYELQRQERIDAEDCSVTGQPVTKPIKLTAKVRAIEALSSKAMSKAELATAIGVSPQTAGIVINELKSEKKIRIDSWVVSRGPHLARYAIGTEPDAQKPEGMTQAERCRRYRNTAKGKKTYRKCRIRWRKSKAGREYTKRRDDARWTRKVFAKKGVSGIDPLMAIFYR